jgi:Na+/proline symporter
MGAALYIYSAKMGIALPTKTDQVYPFLALHHFAPTAGIVFILGIIAASYASTDSALTALTTSFCIDILNIQKVAEEKKKQRLKTLSHLGFTALMLIVVILFAQFNNDALIKTIFKLASYTYGPLLGLYAFGLYSGRDTNDKLVPYFAVVSPLLGLLLNIYSQELFAGYKFGFEILIVNGGIMYGGLLLFSKKQI